MKIRILFIIFLLFIFTGCNSRNQELWNICFYTSNSNGVCYYIYNKTIFTASGELIFQNDSNVPVHLFIYNDTANGRLEYEADLDLGGILSYPNLDKDSSYTVGVRVFDGKGHENITVRVYSNFDLIYKY